MEQRARADPRLEDPHARGDVGLHQDGGQILGVDDLRPAGHLQHHLGQGRPHDEEPSAGAAEHGRPLVGADQVVVGHDADVGVERGVGAQREQVPPLLGVDQEHLLAGPQEAAVLGGRRRPVRPRVARAGVHRGQEPVLDDGSDGPRLDEQALPGQQLRAVDDVLAPPGADEHPQRGADDEPGGVPSGHAPAERPDLEVAEDGLHRLRSGGLRRSSSGGGPCAGRSGTRRPRHHDDAETDGERLGLGASTSSETPPVTSRSLASIWSRVIFSLGRAHACSLSDFGCGRLAPAHGPDGHGGDADDHDGADRRRGSTRGCP